jgi:hypothetical protein
MADVTVAFGEQTLRKEQQGIQFRACNSKGELIGTMVVSKGGLRWWAPNEKKDGHYVSWTQFAQIMAEKPRK